MNASDYCMLLRISVALFMSAVDRQSENPRSTEHMALSSRRFETLFVQLVAWCMLQKKPSFLMRLRGFVYVALEIWDELSSFSVFIRCHACVKVPHFRGTSQHLVEKDHGVSYSESHWFTAVPQTGRKAVKYNAWVTILSSNYFAQTPCYFFFYIFLTIYPSLPTDFMYYSNVCRRTNFYILRSMALVILPSHDFARWPYYFPVNRRRWKNIEV